MRVDVEVDGVLALVAPVGSLNDGGHVQLVGQSLRGQTLKVPRSNLNTQVS